MTKKLYKSRNDCAISGVCAGIANYFNIDVVIVRLLTVICCFVSFGAVLIAYIIAAIVIPEEPTVRMSDGSSRPVYETTYEYRDEAGGGQYRSQASGGAQGAEFYTGGEGGAAGDGNSRQTPGGEAGKEERTGVKSSGTWIIGIVLIALGAYLILDWFFPWISWRIIAAGAFIGLGLVVLLKK